MSDYMPPDGLSVSIKLGENDYIPADGLKVSINLSTNSVPAITQYIGGEGTGFESFANGQPDLRLQYRKLPDVSVGNTALFGTAKVFLYSRFISSTGLNFSAYGTQKIINKNRYISCSGINALAIGSLTIQNFKRFLNGAGLNASSFGNAKIQSLKTFVSTSGINFLAFGSIRISYKEQKTTATGFDALKLGNQLVAFAVRNIEMSSGSADMSRFGTQWIEYNPRYLEPRGIFEQLPSNHKVSPKIFIQPEGFNATRFGTRIIPEIQTLYPKGFESLFGNQEVYNLRQIIKPKGFLSVGEFPEYRWGRADVWNKTKYIIQNHDPDDGLNPPNLNLPNLADRTIVQNRNRLIGMVGVLHQRFGYQNIENSARVLNPTGIASLIEIVKSKTMVSDRIRHYSLLGISAPMMSNWHQIHLGARLIQAHSLNSLLFGLAEVVNTRRNYRFIGLGDQALFGQAMVGDRVRSLSFEQRFTIAPPLVPLPLVKLGTRYIESIGFSSSRMGWNELVIRWNKLYPRWELKNSIGEPSIKNVTPELRSRGQDFSLTGYPKIDLFKRYIQPDGLSQTLFGRIAIGDSKQYIKVIGIADPLISRIHDVKRLGGQYIPHVIDLTGQGLLTESFELNPDKYHRIIQNVLRPESEQPMTRFGSALVAANSIRVEPGYWEILFGRPDVTHKNRQIKVAEFMDVFDPPKLRISPHTIYAGIVNPPQQAIQNHVRPLLQLHPIEGLDASGNRKEPGTEFGVAAVSHKTRQIKMSGKDLSLLGAASIKQTRFIITPNGFHSLRVGVLAPIGNQEITVRNNSNASVYGQASVNHVESFHRKIELKGMNWSEFGKNEIQLLHRTVFPSGLAALGMGSKKLDDQPYMWQGLRIGAHIPTNIGGMGFSEFGVAWISHWVRELLPVGLDYAQVNQYDYTEFEKRMRVVRRESPNSIPVQHVKPTGFNASMFNASDIKNKAHFIRPDGNANQYRKGAF